MDNFHISDIPLSQHPAPARSFSGKLHDQFVVDVIQGGAGTSANPERCRELVENSIGLVTALNPHIGYEKSAAIAKEAMASGRSVYDIVLDRGYLSREDMEDVLKPENMVRPRYVYPK